MKICLKTSSTRDEVERLAVQLTERLPDYLQAPCDVVCDYRVTLGEDYYLLSLELSGHLMTTCQRCLATFEQAYNHHVQLAICSNDESAEKIMPLYESIVVQQDLLDLTDLLTDELHFSSSEMHLSC